MARSRYLVFLFTIAFLVVNLCGCAGRYLLSTDGPILISGPAEASRKLHFQVSVGLSVASAAFEVWSQVAERDKGTFVSQMRRVLRGLRAVLSRWKELNAQWISGGDRPADWNTAVCLPLVTGAHAALDLAKEIAGERALIWEPLVQLVPLVCEAGNGQG